jgi:hypothetical protein
MPVAAVKRASTGCMGLLRLAARKMTRVSERRRKAGIPNEVRDLR